jgi:LysM repeat protein
MRPEATDPYLRRIYLSIAVLLSILFLGMLFLAFQALEPAIFSLLSSQPRVSSLEDFTPLLQVPDIQFTVYDTKPGDTYESIAAVFHRQVETLRSLNQANDFSEPRPDTPVLIPSRDGIFYLVRPGQGLADIARAYGISLKVVMEANHKRDDSDLSPGDVLYLPGAPYLARRDPRWQVLSSLCSRKLFIKPTTGRLSSGFGMRLHPILHKMLFHKGIDLAPGWGARVVAAQDGRVLFAGIGKGYGRLVILAHGKGLTSYYAHLEKILVKPGEEVKQGTLIGLVGSSGLSTGPHLYFEIRLNGKPQNPLLYMVP